MSAGDCGVAPGDGPFEREPPLRGFGGARQIVAVADLVVVESERRFEAAQPQDGGRVGGTDPHLPARREPLFAGFERRELCGR
jgi:hypothetical protein